MRLALQVLSVVVSLLAAWLWWRASSPPPPPNITWDGSIGQALEEWMRTSARANSWAARCTAVAVVLQAASAFWR
jgi:hypothetical protein